MVGAIGIDFQKALRRLEEALSVEKTDTSRDSAIMRFQLCFDLAWKSVKAYAKNEGSECYSPRSCFKTAFQLGLIDYDQGWSDMIVDRNDIAHTYKEELAERIYGKLTGHLKLFKQLVDKLGALDAL